MNLAINWNFNPQLFSGMPTPNWYGLLFVGGMMLGFVVIRKMFRKEEIPDAQLDKLLIYVVIATLLGARLGHVFFYDWHIYKNDLLSIFKIWEGGLASHGGAIALLIALWMYNRIVTKKHILWIFDKVSAPIALAAAFIRLGNLANGEIVGHETKVPWAFKFARNDWSEADGPVNWAMIPARHPSQLYEAIAYLIIFAILLFVYWKKQWYLVAGKVFGLFLILVFGIRFVLEYYKEGQTDRDEIYAINTGQMLSVPFVILGLILLYLAFRKKKTLAV